MAYPLMAAAPNAAKSATKPKRPSLVWLIEADTFEAKVIE